MDMEYRAKQTTLKRLKRSFGAPFFWSADIHVGMGLFTHR